MRICSSCQGELEHADGWDTSAAERAGNALEVDEFRCKACGLLYRHQVDERFSGDIHRWWSRPTRADEWQLLDESEWPTFAPRGVQS